MIKCSFRDLFLNLQLDTVKPVLNLPLLVCIICPLYAGELIRRVVKNVWFTNVHGLVKTSFTVPVSRCMEITIYIPTDKNA